MNVQQTCDAMYAAKRIADELQPAYWLMAAEKDEAWYVDKVKAAHEGFADLAKAMGHEVNPTPVSSLRGSEETDARRYRWLKMQSSVGDQIRVMQSTPWTQWDEAIDAALSATATEGE